MFFICLFVCSFQTQILLRKPNTHMRKHNHTVEIYNKKRAHKFCAQINWKISHKNRFTTQSFLTQTTKKICDGKVHRNSTNIRRQWIWIYVKICHKQLNDRTKAKQNTNWNLTIRNRKKKSGNGSSNNTETTTLTTTGQQRVNKSSSARYIKIVNRPNANLVIHCRRCVPQQCASLKSTKSHSRSTTGKRT